MIFVVDLRELPSVPSLVASIQRIRNGDWDVLCAAGMMGHHRTTKYYDTFATILANGVLIASPNMSVALANRLCV